MLDIINNKTVADLWVKKSFFSDEKPNVELVYKLGKELDIDVVLMFRLTEYFRGSSDTIVIEAYLIDGHRKVMYSAKGDILEPVTKEILSQYK